MRKYKILFIAFLFLFRLVQAQSDYRPGYIIELSGDTLHGEIDYRGDLLMGSICKFKTVKNDVTSYSPREIKAYRFVGSKFFVSRDIKEKVVFLEFLIRGKINVYYLRDKSGDHYFIDKENDEITEIPFEEGVKYVGNKTVAFSTNDHNRILNYYMQDAPQLKSKIDLVKKPEHNSLIKIAKDYHNATCKNEECVIFEKQQRQLKVNLELLSGFSNYGEIEDINDINYLSAGLLAHFWMPGVNEKLYFKTGFLYSKVEVELKKKIDLYMPVQIGYIAPSNRKIRPTISLDLLKPSYSGGVYVHLNNTINIGVLGWANFYSNEKFFLAPEELRNYSILASMVISL